MRSAVLHGGPACAIEAPSRAAGERAAEIRRELAVSIERTIFNEDHHLFRDMVRGFSRTRQSPAS